MILDWIFILVGVAGLTLTGLLAVVDEMTVSQRAQALLPRWADWLVGIGGMLALCFLPLSKPVAVFWAGFWGHIWIANKERYEHE